MNAVPTFAVAPGRLPLIGHGVTLMRRPLAFLQSLHGMADVVQVEVGPLRTLWATTPRLMNSMLMDWDDVLAKGRFYEKTLPLTGNGVINASGAEHRRQMKLIKPALHRPQIANYTDTMKQVALDRIGSWRSGQTVQIDKEMHAITLGILARTMFGSQVAGDACTELTRHLPIVLKGLMWRTVAPAWILRLPIPINRRVDRAIRELRGAITKVTWAYRDANVDNGDMLSMLLAARDESTGEPMSDEEICNQIVSVTLAGSETAATVLTWLCYEVARQPEIRGRIIAELSQVIGDREIQLEDVSKLEYMRRVLQETLRMRQPILVVSRRTIDDFDLGGRRVPAGTELFFSPYTAFRDPSSFPNPMTFDPDRWLDQPDWTLPRGAYTPFGGGRRRCLGEHFAWTMMTMVMAVLLGRFEWDLPDGFVAREMPWATVNPHRMPITLRAVSSGESSQVPAAATDGSSR